MAIETERRNYRSQHFKKVPREKHEVIDEYPTAVEKVILRVTDRKNVENAIKVNELRNEVPD